MTWHMINRGPSSRRSILEIWKYLYNEFPDVTQVKTPFWPSYSREQVSIAAHSARSNSIDWDAILPQHRERLREAIRALTEGRHAHENPSPFEARHYEQMTRIAYEQYAPEYFADTADRTSLDQLLIKFLSLVGKEGPILDVGCGPGHDSVKIQAHAKCVIGVDLALPMLRLAQGVLLTPANLVQMDMRILGFREKTVAGIWCAAALLHLQRRDILGTLLEFWRILRPGAFLFLSVKQGTGTELVQRVKTGGLPRIFTYFSREEMLDYLREVRFHVYEVTKNLFYRDGVGWDVWLNILACKGKR